MDVLLDTTRSAAATAWQASLAPAVSLEAADRHMAALLSVLTRHSLLPEALTGIPWPGILAVTVT
jgi:hypothetical protein